MNILPRRETTRSQWDEVVHSSPDGWVWALWAWQEAILAVPRWQLDERGFAVEQNGRLIAVVPLHYLRADCTLDSSGWGWAGPVVRAALSRRHHAKVLRTVFDRMREIAHADGAVRIEVGQMALTGRSLENRWGINPFVPFGFRDTSSQSLLVNLRQSEAELWQGLAENARQTIRKAREAGYSVERGDWTAHLDAYFRVHEETYRRTGIPPHPKEYFVGLAGADLRQHTVLWVGRDWQGRPVAFHNDARFGAASLYHTGCCETAHLESGINALLFWQAMLGARQDGCDWYESGEIFPAATSGKDYGLTVFKSKFGGEPHRSFRGVWEAPGAESAPAANTALRDWLVSSRALLRSTAGTRATAGLETALRLGWRGLRRLARIGGRGCATAVKAVRPPVPFLRPGWEEAELRAARHPAHEDALQAERALVEALRARLPAADNALIIPVGSGRSALELALRVLARREPGRRKVLLPSYGCRGTFDPVLQAGLTPMFVDIDDDLRPDPQDLLDRLDESVLACLLVHLCGKRTPFEPVAERAKRLGVRLIEDNCQNLGGIGLDTPADLAIYSFGVGKQAMATAGGALVVHALKDAFLEAQRELGQEPAASAPARFEFLCNVGHPRWPLLNGGQQPHQMDPAIQTQFGPVRISPLDARLATVQLGKLDAIVAGHVANAGRFRAALGRYPRLFQCQDPDDHVYSLFSVRLPSAALTDRFRAFMDRCGVEVEGMYIPLHQRDFGAPFATRALPGSEAAHRHVVNLPVRPNLTERERVRIEKALDAFGKKERHAV